MADLVLGIAGAGVGSLFGNPMLGFSIGMTLGGLLFPPSQGTIQVNRMKDLRIQSSSYDTPIPLLIGENRTAGIIVWGTDIREVKKTSGGGKGKPKTSNYSYFINIAIEVCAGPIYKIEQILANAKPIYDNTASTDYVAASPVTNHGSAVWKESFLDLDDIRIYLGTKTQPKDPLIEADKGSAFTPAYRRRVLVVLENFPLHKFNGQIPNLEFVCRSQEGDLFLVDVLNQLCDMVKIPTDSRDFSEVSSLKCDGLMVGNRTACKDVLSSLQDPYYFDLVEYDGKIQARDRTDPTISAIIDDGFLSAGVDEIQETPYQFKRNQEVEVPQRVEVSYISKANNLQVFKQGHQRISGQSQDVNSITVPVVMSEIDAKKLVVIKTFTNMIERNTMGINLPFYFANLAPGDRVQVPTELGLLTFKILDITTNLFGQLEYSMIEYDPVIYTQDVDGSTVDNPGSGLSTDGESVGFIIETAGLTDEDTDNIGFYAVMSSTAYSWPGGLMQGTNPPYLRIMPGAKSRKEVTDFNIPADYGIVTVFDSGASLDNKFNYDTSITVQMSRGKPVSATEAEVLSYANVAVWGNEVIQWVTSTDLGGGNFELSGLLRARKGTDWATTHIANEPFIIVDEDTFRRVDAYIGEKGLSHGYRFYENDKSYTTDPAIQTLVLAGNSRKPYSPVNIAASRDGSGNITLTWLRRARKDNEWEDGHEVALDETTEQYDIEIYASSSYASVKRTLSSTIPTVVYSAANQVTDFGSNQATIYVKIYQVSDVVGRGFPGKAQV